MKKKDLLKRIEALEAKANFERVMKDGNSTRDVSLDNISKAFKEEVEEALIKEAKKRGFERHVCFTDFKGVKQRVGSYINLINGNLYARGYGRHCIFQNGKWAEVFNQEEKKEELDKFAELKEAYKNGAVIELWSDIFDKWIEVALKHDLWLPDREYRIKPDDKPKVGDVCKFWDGNENVFVIGILVDINDSDFAYNVNNADWYCNAKKLTPDDVTTLLFKGNGAN